MDMSKLSKAELIEYIKYLQMNGFSQDEFETCLEWEMAKEYEKGKKYVIKWGGNEYDPVMAGRRVMILPDPEDVRMAIETAREKHKFKRRTKVRLSVAEGEIDD